MGHALYLPASLTIVSEHMGWINVSLLEEPTVSLWTHVHGAYDV